MEPAAFRRALKARGVSAALLARRQWRSLASVGDWKTIATRLALIVTAAQQGAAQDAKALLATTLGEAPKISPVAFSGFASDGRPLRSLLYSPVPYARSLYGSGLTGAEVMRAAEVWLGVHVRTQVADAGRAATSVGVTATEGAGWYRYVAPPCCQRCAVLAGKWFRWNEGFARHPGCDCTHAPAARGAPPGFTATIGPEDVHDLTEAQRKALAEGGDFGKVINAYRSTHPGQDLNAVTQAGRRLTPDGIYQQAHSREHAVELLRQHGYLR